MPRQVEPSRRKKILDMYQEGASLTAIARETGAARATIRNVLAADDITLRPRGHPEEIQEEIARCHAAGDGITTIARDMGMATSTVLRMIKKSGVHRRKLENRRDALKALPLVADVEDLPFPWLAARILERSRESVQRSGVILRHLFLAG